MSNAARDTLLDEARKERSSAIVIVKDGQITLEAYRDGYAGEPLLAMSASKSIASLAVGLLVADGKLTLDTRMDSIFPEWKNLGAKSGITVRQLLSHTSGLDPTRASFQTGETIREHVLRSPLVFKPGTRFQYNNNAADFVAVVVAQVARMPLDAFLKARLFDALEMLDVSWMKDSEGTPRAAGELVIRPVDLAKIGQLMLDEGRWKGAQLVSADWIRISTRPSQSLEESCGLLWWVEGSFSFALTEPVLDAWRDRHVDDATIQQARGLLGQRFPTREAYRKALASRLGPAAADRIDAALKGANHIDVATHVSDGPVRGFSARGSLGQFLVVYPKARVVAVRMRASGPRDQAGGPERNGFRHFADDVAELYPQQ